MSDFELISKFKPQGDQPQAIEKIYRGLIENDPSFQTLLGVTGSGKTFTMANVIAQYGRPTLVISHNKTLAAQLYEELREFFPNNAVEYFVSYYDYYQPEAYIPQRDIYIEKDAARNDDLDRLRMAATSALLSRKDVVIIASVSCIFGLGDPEDYKSLVMTVACGEDHDRNDLLAKLIEMQYERTEMDLLRGKFRPRGDSLEIYPSYAEYAYRIEFFGDQIDRIDLVDPLTGRTLKIQQNMVLYPAKHYVVPEDNIAHAIKSIEEELEQRLVELKSQGKLLEAQRLNARTRYDMEMIQEVGYCSGIENYSRHLSGRAPGSKPYTLIDYFPKDFLLVIDESHVTIPQIRAMYAGDRHRKDVLVEHGFRLPSALDNRPLTFDEFESVWKKVVFVSATPAPYELTKSGGEFVEQIIRPTGLIDPVIHVLPARGQVEHLLGEIKKRVARQERILVTTLTKKMSEDLAQYIREENISCNYLHSEVETLERVEILKDLRLGKYDVIVGVNLLREGLDLPEVSMVAILDSDKQGFLRSPTSLIQMIGRAARNVNAEVFLYADKITPAMQQAIDETERRRKIQEQYNRENNITPQTIRKAIRDGLETEITARKLERDVINIPENDYEQEELIRMLEQEMYEAARNMEFEKAALIRDKLMEVRKQTNLGISPMVPESQRKTSAAKPKFKRNSKKSR
ncbi:MAG: excinuclease ABC subunit UvrB [Phycisphaerae bacterium]|jgi:excinuclease ABC subunit B|nr:excinuclease ABC subunit UvrB [Phycisphaerae bacterium]